MGGVRAQYDLFLQPPLPSSPAQHPGLQGDSPDTFSYMPLDPGIFEQNVNQWAKHRIHFSGKNLPVLLVQNDFV